MRASKNPKPSVTGDEAVRPVRGRGLCYVSVLEREGETDATAVLT